jgi:hypothetical protein
MRRATFCGNAREPACRNEIGQVTPVFEEVGAGEGNRTLVISLEELRRLININGFSEKTTSFGALRYIANSRRSEWPGAR